MDGSDLVKSLLTRLSREIMHSDQSSKFGQKYQKKKWFYFAFWNNKSIYLQDFILPQVLIESWYLSIDLLIYLFIYFLSVTFQSNFR